MFTIIKPKAPFNVEEIQLQTEMKELFSLSTHFTLEIYDIYQFEQVTKNEQINIEKQLFDSTKEEIMHQLPLRKQETSFRFRQVTGQYNEKEQMVEKVIQKISGIEEGKVHHSRIFQCTNIQKNELEKIKKYYLNPVEYKEISFEATASPIPTSKTDDLKAIDNFLQMNEKEIEEFGQQFSMDQADLLLCQEYFQKENRQPNLSELKVIDTYWSDHCRHTTFGTELAEIQLEDGPYKDLFTRALNDYYHKRTITERTDRPITLMDLGTIQAKALIKKGLLNNVEISAEINAAALEIKVDVAGTEEDWILYFKNETHNHPTEIEPFGGASTCLGGAVRDPLSGRSWVYQAMRISGGKNPKQPLADVRPNKLPQRVISQQSLLGYSDYANQIGVAGTFAEEVYHPGFEAKRMELGALIAAAPRKNIVRSTPLPGDQIVLLGGKTGRDGLGGAVGSSQIQTEESLESAGAEVQKGNPAVERKITRLFRNEAATVLIKRCNDFGAGGVSVAVGELADGIEIDLDAVPTKYEGMHGGEIALSESQERMAVVVAKKDLEAFLDYAHAEDVESAVIAQVTADDYISMIWQGEEIIRISRKFLDSNGAPKFSNALLKQPKNIFETPTENKITGSKKQLIEYITDLNRASQQAMAEHFDASIGRASVLNPYGGIFKKTKELGMISRLPVRGGQTKTISGMAYGYEPQIAENSPFHGGYYAVVESVARMVAMGFDYKEIRLTFQEYFETLQDDPVRWGKPVLALLGANTAMSEMEIGAIGGKDSMSGTFEELDVPPTLISFAVAPGKIDQVASRAFKKEHSLVALIENPLTDEGIIHLQEAQQNFSILHKKIKAGKIKAASTVGFHGLLKEIIEMSLGNQIGLTLEEDIIERLTEPMLGSFIVEVEQEQDLEGLHYTLVGKTCADYLKIGTEQTALVDILTASEEVFASVYQPMSNQKRAVLKKTDHDFKERLAVEKPRVLLPVLLGNNAEYDLQDAFEQAGFEVQQIVIADSSTSRFEETIKEFIEQLPKYHVLAFAGGAVFGNQPQDVGRIWNLLFKRTDIQEVIEKHLEKKHLIFGSGTGLASLISSGLIEHGKITTETSIQILPNKENKFFSDLVPAQISSSHSPWSQNLQGENYTTAIATKWGRIDLGAAEEKLYENGQVISAFTKYFSQENIDGLASPDGLIFGTLSNIERMDQKLYQNIGDIQCPPFIQNARNYFNHTE